MNQRQDSSTSGDGWRWELEQAFQVYSRYLARERGWLWFFLFILVSLGLSGLSLQPADSPEHANLAVLVTVAASITAYLLSNVLQGGQNLAREVFHLHNLSQTGFDPRRIADRRTPPFGWAIPSWLLYWAKISYFPVRNNIFYFYREDYSNAQPTLSRVITAYYAQCTLNRVITAYYCTCIQAGVPAMRTADLIAFTVWGGLTLTSLALALIYMFIYKQSVFTDQGITSIPFCAIISAIGAHLPLLLLINGCLTSFIQALRTYISKLPRAWPPPVDEKAHK
jgi:hypothetical protein